MKQADLSSLQRKYLSLHGEPSNIALVNGGPWSQKAFLFFFPYQSILCGDFEAQVIIFFLYRQGVCLNSHNWGYPKFLFFFFFCPQRGVLLWVDQPWLLWMSQNPVCKQKKKKWYQKWIWHPSLNSLEEPWKCEMMKRIWNAFAESIVSQPWSQVLLKSIGNDRTCDDSWLAMLLGNACSLCRAGDWKVAGLIPTKYNQCT